MKIKKFSLERDLERLSVFLRERYFESGRKDFYNAAGFNTETEVHFWYKTLNADK